MRRAVSVLAVLGVLLGVTAMPTAAPQPAAAVAVSQSFEAVFGQLVFQNTSARTTARNVITKYVARQQFDEPTIQDVPAGKYGAGPALLVTLRLAARADADEVWADITGNVLSVLRPTSIIRQSSVTFDAEEGTQTVTEIHRRTVPAAPDDF